MSDTCKDCENFRTIGFCTTRDNYTNEEDTACSEFEGHELYTQKTLFDRLTASPEVLAPKLVYVSLFNACWYSTLTGDVMYKSREEAEAATVEKLKEIAQ